MVVFLVRHVVSLLVFSPCQPMVIELYQAPLDTFPFLAGAYSQAYCVHPSSQYSQVIVSAIPNSKYVQYHGSPPSLWSDPEGSRVIMAAGTGTPHFDSATPPPRFG